MLKRLRRAGWSSRPVAPALVALLALGACGPEFAVIPRGGQPRIEAPSPVGLTLTALAAQWDAYPDDLADYITPIAIELTNTGPYEVRVSYADFALRDERGQRYPAVNPFVPAALSQATSPFAGQTLLAARGGGFGGHGGYHGGYRGGYRGGVTVGPPGGGWRRGVRSYGSFGVYGGGWRGYHVLGGLRGYYGPRAWYWGGPLWYSPYYAEWVFWWGPRYYPARPSADVLRFALPEGVLAPGGQVTGYLYFQKATGQGSRSLDLGWDMHDARNGNALGSTHVPLEIVVR